MQLLERFNPYDHNPEAPVGGNLPVGKHPVVIIAAEVVPTKNNDGGMVVFTLQIIDGPAKGSDGVYRVNLYNSSEKAKKIAQSQLSALCYVTGQFQLGQNGDDLTVLFGKPFMVEVTVQAQNDQYTEIKAVMDIHGNKPKAGGQPQQQQPQNQGFGNQQQPAQNNAAQGGGWGGAQTAQHPAQQPAQGGQPAWGGGGSSNAPAQGGGWQQNQNQGNKPAWG